MNIMTASILNMLPGTCSTNLVKPRNEIRKQITANFLISISLATVTNSPGLGTAVLLQVYAASARVLVLLQCYWKTITG